MNKVWYMHRDNGDGSASTLFFETERLAELEEEWELLITGIGWGEPSVSSFEGYCESAQRAKDSYAYKVAELDYYEDHKEKEKLLEIVEEIRSMML